MMAKADSKGPRIRFESLSGEPDDGEDELDPEFVDPLDAEPGERGRQEEEEPDPRANDPFVDRDEDEPETKLQPLRKDDPDREPEERQEEPPPGPSVEELSSQLAEAKRRIDELEATGRISAQEAEQRTTELRDARSKQIDGDIASARKALKQAIEDGEVDAQVEHNEKLADLIAAKRELSAQPAKRQAEQPPQQDAPVVRAQTPEAARWMAGKAWINNPAHKAENADLLRVATDVYNDGLQPSSQAYYDELERRLKLRHPSLFPAPAQGGNGHRQPARQQVGRVSRDDPPAGNGSKGRTAVLTSDDQLNMQRFGLDPRNKDQVREYLRNKIPEKQAVRV